MEITLSQSTLENISRIISPSIFSPSIFIPIALAIISVGLALLSLYIADKALKLSKDDYSSSFYFFYLELMNSFDNSKSGDSDYQKYFNGRVCDFLETVCYAKHRNKISSEDMYLFDVVMLQDSYIIYARLQNKVNFKSYTEYLKWVEHLKKNN